MNILNKLTIKHLMMNKKRTIVTIVGIILSTALMVGIGLLFSSLREYSVKEVIASNGRYQSYIKNVDSGKLDIIDKNLEIDSYFYDQGLGFSKLENSTNPYKPYIFIDQVSSSYFNELKLTDGRFPKNSDEIVISNHIKTNGGVNYKIGDKITFTYGKRDNKDLVNDKYEENEQLITIGSHEYTVVGIVERTPYESYSASGYNVFTLFNGKPTGLVNTYVVFKDVKDIYKKSEKLYDNLEVPKLDGEIYNIEYNTALLALKGNSGNGNFDSMIMNMMTIMLVLVSVGCIIVIYNAFAISVMERKKQFGLFSSVGATRRQLRKTVFFEALIVGFIGITLGIASSFLGIGIVLKILNYLMADIFEFGFELVVYPLYIILPIIFMILVVLVSAYLPARSASRVSPITAIRQNDDIKIKGKKLKTNRFISRVFGIEGELALKNIKRNKKKYRITIASLFISIVLFITFSAYLLYGLSGSEDFFGTYSFDAFINVTDGDNTEINKQVSEAIKLPDVEESLKLKMIMVPIKKIDNSLLNDKMVELNKSNSNSNIDYLYVVNVEDKVYQEYLNQLGLTTNQPIFFNTYKTVRYEESGRKNYDLTVLKGNSINFEICDLREELTKGNEIENSDTNKLCTYKLNNIFVTTETRFGFDMFNDFPFVILVNNETFKEIYDHYEYEQHIDKQNRQVEAAEYYVFFKASNFDKLNKIGNDLNGVSGTTYLNITESTQLQKNIILALKILLYGFISLVTLIGVTSVFNTINTSIALRRKEFAMLRSVGLTPHGFNKILYLESMFFGLKSLLYALPFSIGIVYLIYRSMGSLIYSDKFILPWSAIIIAIISVFVIVLITMLYAAKRIKKENILDAIREENI